MTVESATSRESYVGNGATDTYDFGWKISSKNELLVVQQDTDGVETELAVDTDYTVSGVGDPDGGSIVLTAGNLTSGYTLIIRPAVPKTQPTDLRNQGSAFKETIEQALDRLTRMVHDLDDRLTRALTLRETDFGAASTELPKPAAGKVLGWDSDGDAIENKDPGSVALATPGDGTCTNEKLADMAQGTIKGRQRGSGTGDPEDMTPAQARVAIFDHASGQAQAAHIGDEQVTTPKVPANAIEHEKLDANARGLLYDDNLVINGGMDIWQRYDDPSVAANKADAAWFADRWRALTESADIDVARVAGGDQPYAARLTQKNASAQRIGLITSIEHEFCRHKRSKQVTFRARVRASAGCDIAVAVMETTSAADSIAADPFVTWGVSPTYVANQTETGRASATLVANTWTEITGTVTLGASFNNLRLLIYTTSQLAQNVTLDVEAVEIIGGAKLPALFKRRQFGIEEILCKRYYEVKAVTHTDQENSGNGMMLAVGTVASATRLHAMLTFMRKAHASLSLSYSNVAHFETYEVGTGRACTALALAAAGSARDTAWLMADVASGMTAGRAAIFKANSNDAWLAIEAEVG